LETATFSPAGNPGVNSPAIIQTIIAMNRRPILPGHSIQTALATTIVVLSALAGDAVAQIEITVSTGSTSQNFDTLITGGTNQPWTNDTTLALDDSTLNGWSLFTYTNLAIGDYNAGAGGSSTGKFYSFGTGTNTERALGGVASGNTYFGSPGPATGAVAGYITFAATNNSPSTLGKFTLGFDGEQWRNGGSSNATPGVAQTMVFEYGFGATFADVGNWQAPGGNFDWASPVFGTVTAAAVDGNVAGLVSARGGTINGLSWATGETLWLRWIERNDANNDHGLAIDNFSLSWETAPPAKDLVWTPTSADWNTTDTNWKDTNNNNIVAFANNDTVTFDSTGLAQPNVQVAAGGVSPNAMTVNVGVLETYRISGGAINTNAPLQKQGVGTLELGSVYLGGLNAAAGTVRTLANDVFGDSSPVVLGNNATFDLNHHNETIGALDLTGANITTGAGLLTVMGNITVQESPTNTPTTIGGAISVGTGIHNLTVADSMAPEDLIINADISGSARIALSGPGTVQLNGDNSAYTGQFQMNSPGATVVINTVHPFGTGTGFSNALFFNAGVIRAAIPLTGANKLVTLVSIGGFGGTIEGEDVEIGGTFSFFGGSPKTLTINGDTVVTFSGIVENGDNNPNASLTIAGTGTAIITANASTYTGAFQVGDGITLGSKVILDTATGLPFSPVTVNAFSPGDAELIVKQSAPIGGLNSGGTEGVVTLGDGAPSIDPVVLTLQPELTPNAGDAFYAGTIRTAPGFTGGVVKDGAAAQTLSGPLMFDTLTVLEGTLILDNPLEDAVVTLTALNIGADGVVVLRGPSPPGPAAGPQAVPEPGAFTLLLAGAIGLLGRRRR
jgi:autotransporter-associated beta strand protein